MSAFILGTTAEFAGYAVGPTKLVQVSTNLWAIVYIRDSDDYPVVKGYSYSNGVWTAHAGAEPLFASDAWYNTACPIHLCKIADGDFIMQYHDTSSWLTTRVVSISTGAVVDQGAKSITLAAATRGCIARLADNKVVLAYRLTSDNKLYAVIGTVVGQIVNIGTPVEMDASTPHHISIEKIGTDKFAILYDNVSDSKVSLVIGTVSGTTITAGTPVDISGETGGDNTDIIWLGTADQFIALWTDSSYDGRAAAVTVVTRTPTVGASVELTADHAINTQGIKINTTEFMLAYSKASTTGEALDCSVDWGTRVITGGTPYEWHSSAISGGTDKGLGFEYISERVGAIAYQDGGDSDKGKLVSITSAISPPSNVAAVTGSSQGEITLSWDAVNGASSYNGYWANATGVTQGTGTKLEGITSPYTHSGLTLSDQYFYVVTAIIGGNESVDSSEVNAWPKITTPTNFIAESTLNGISLTWDANADGAVSYIIYYDTSTGVTKSTTNTITREVNQYNHTNFTADAVYYYYIITAIAGTNESDASNEANAYGVYFSKYRAILLSLLPKGKAWGK